MKLSFSNKCSPLNVTTGPTTGISDVECFIISNGINSNPTLVSSYKISELDERLMPVRVNNVQNVSLVDGADVTFVSNTNTNPGFVSGGLQVSMSGFDEASQPITLDFSVKYTNLCANPPFAYGDGVGWLKFVSP